MLRGFRILFCLVLGMGLAPAVRADDAPIDVVVLVDVTREIEQERNFVRARQLVLDLVDRAAVPGAQFALIPFGDGVHEPFSATVARDRAGAAEARSGLRRHVESLRAQDPHRFLHAALERAVVQLRTFARLKPDHERRIVVVSQGSQHLPRGTLERDLVDRLASAGDRQLRPGRDWTLWYGHFGAGDPDLLEFIAQRGIGTSLRLDRVESMRWTRVRVETPFVAVGPLPEGEWKRRVLLFVSGAVNAELLVRTDPGSSAVGATLTALPIRPRLKRTRSTVPIMLSGYRPAGAHYERARLRVDGAGPWPIWVTGGRVSVDAGPDDATATIDVDELRFERVDRGTRMAKLVRIRPNATARRRKMQLGFEVRDLPPDVDLVVEPEVVHLDEEREIKVRLRPRASAKPGAHESRIVFVPRGGLRVRPRELTIQYRIGHGSVRVEESELAFGDVVRGSSKTARITLAPDQGALEAGAQLRVEALDVPDGVELQFLEQFSLFERTALEVRARVKPGVEAQDLTFRLRFVAAGEVRMVPPVVPVRLRVVPPPAVALTREIDVGSLFQTELEGKEFSFPIDVDPSHQGTILRFQSGEAGTRMQPSELRLKEGRHWLKLQLYSDKTTPGAHRVPFTVTSIRGRGQRSEGTVHVAWKVRPSYVRVAQWIGPSTMEPDSTMVSGTLVLESSPDLAGHVVSIEARFEPTELKSQMAMVVDSIELKGGSQSITIPIDVVHAEPGTYRGVLDPKLLRVQTLRNELDPIAFQFEVTAPPSRLAQLTPEKRRKLILVAGLVAMLLAVLLWMMRRNRRPVHRVVQFTPPPEPEARGMVVDDAHMFSVEDR
ncbi:MAG: vWA domain-containing protein [Planctomycetota bacterium]